MWNFAKTGLEDLELVDCFTEEHKRNTASTTTTATVSTRTFGIEIEQPTERCSEPATDNVEENLLARTHAGTENEQPSERCSEPAAESAEETMSTRTNAGNWNAHRDGLEPNEENMDAQETGLKSSKILVREIADALEEGWEPNEDVNDAQEDGLKSSKMLVGETFGQEDEPKSSKGLVGDIKAQERGLEPNGEYMKRDIGAHEEGFTRLGRKARVEEICTERLRGATTRIQNHSNTFFQERREDRFMFRIRNLVKLENQQSVGNFYCCHDRDTIAQWAQTTRKFYFSVYNIDLSAQWAVRGSDPTTIGQDGAAVEGGVIEDIDPGLNMPWGRGVRGEDVVRSGAGAAMRSTLGD